MQWNSKIYDQQHAFVSQYGEGLVQVLAAQPGERILDLGCGTGDLTDIISRSGAVVTGLDNSAEMIEAARKKYPHIPFELQSADHFHFDTPFDAIFSNAALHWVLHYEDAVRCMHRALRPGGRLVAEMGGKGNVSGIITALKHSLRKYGYAQRADTPVWYFPSPGEYASLLEQHGFRVAHAFHFDRPTPLKDEKGIQHWLGQFGQLYFQDLPEQNIAAIISDVEQQLRPTHFVDGQWVADYVRLRIIAVKE